MLLLCYFSVTGLSLFCCLYRFVLFVSGIISFLLTRVKPHGDRLAAVGFEPIPNRPTPRLVHGNGIPLGWDGTHRTVVEKLMIEKLPELTELSLSETVDE